MNRWVVLALCSVGGCAYLGRATGTAVRAGPGSYSCAREVASGLGYHVIAQDRGRGQSSFRAAKPLGRELEAELYVAVYHSERGRGTLQVQPHVGRREGRGGRGGPRRWWGGYERRQQATFGLSSGWGQGGASRMAERDAEQVRGRCAAPREHRGRARR